MTKQTTLARITHAMALAACISTLSGVAAAAEPVAPRVVASGLKAPWSITFMGNTPLVSERGTARILALAPDGSARVIATIAGVDGVGEGGLLGITVHQGFLYVYFTAGEENRIVRYPISGQGQDIRLGTVQRLLGGIPSASYHNGGRLAFGPDGMLYATTGDAGQRSRSQDLKSLGGKILRMTADGQVPADNPFAGSYVYSYGHRNVQGLGWSRDGRLFASEFGENTWDELNLIRPGGNYGWPVVEGRSTQPSQDAKQGFIDPLQQWRPADASPSGLAIVNESIYIANLRGQRLRQIAVATPQAAQERYVRQYGRLRDVVVTPDGKLWLLTNNTDGRGQAQAGDDRILEIPAN